MLIGPQSALKACKPYAKRIPNNYHMLKNFKFKLYRKIEVNVTKPHFHYLNNIWKQSQETKELKIAQCYIAHSDNIFSTRMAQKINFEQEEGNKRFKCIKLYYWLSDWKKSILALDMERQNKYNSWEAYFNGMIIRLSFFPLPWVVIFNATTCWGRSTWGLQRRWNIFSSGNAFWRFMFIAWSPAINSFPGYKI